MPTGIEMLKAERKGAELLHNGAPVEYAPRRLYDRKPWVIRDGLGIHRYTANQCQIHWPKGEPKSGR